MLESGTEFNSVLRAHLHAKLAKYTTSQVIPVFYQYLFLFPGFVGHELGCDLDCPVRAIHFTDTTRDTLVLIVFVMRHHQFAPETVEHL